VLRAREGKDVEATAAGPSLRGAARAACWRARAAARMPTTEE